MKEIICFKSISEFSPITLGIFSVNVYKLKETDSLKTKDNIEENQDFRFLDEESENYVKNSKFIFEKELIGIGKYIPIKNELIY